VLPDDRNQNDSSWSPDGRSLVFGDQPPSSGERPLETLNLESRQLSALPGSKGLFSARWSPDGRHLAALTMDVKALKVFDSTTKDWREISTGDSLGWPSWSRDGTAIYFMRNWNEGIYRVDVVSRRVVQVVDLRNVRLTGVFGVGFLGLTPDDSPLMMRDVSTAEVYAADWQSP
jgi:Tol biopolymer transport system component